MGKTSVLVELENRIKEIESNLLPKINPLGTYTDAELDSIRAYVLLCHAEIECYIEDLARLLVITLEAELANPKAGNKFARYYANKVNANIGQVINTNHGIKTENLKKMFEPFGFEEKDFDFIDSNFLPQMNAFGIRRGESAHRSAKRATRQPSPIKEKKAVAEILKYLEMFEAELIRVRLKGFFSVQ